MKEAVKHILDKLHLLTFFYRLYLRTFGRRRAKELRDKRRLEKEKETFYRSFDRFVEMMEANRPLYRQKTLLFYGYLASARKKMLYEFARAFVMRRQDARAFFLINPIISPRKKDKALTDKVAHYLQTTEYAVFPELAGETGTNLARKLNLELTEEMRDLISRKEYMRQAIENARRNVIFADALDNYVEVLMCEYYRCYQALLDNMNIACAVLWNGFKYNHYLFAEMCRERGINVSFVEFGSLPGTLVLDREGQMGESWPAQHAKEFCALPVNNEDYDRASLIVEKLRESGLNRKRQPEYTDNDELLARLKPGRPILLYAGQYDQDSGMVPYTQKTKQYHSPCFSSTAEAIPFLAEIAARHDWNLIFKPHPLGINDVSENDLPNNVIFIREMNINNIIDLSDVVITILSSVVYVSLIRGKTSVMLGYNQIHGKGCAYEALSREEIEPTLVEAVEKGYTPERREAFIRHVAQMEKYYLFSDGNDVEGLRIGRGTQQAAAYLAELIEASHKPVQEEDAAAFICSSLADVISAAHVRNSLCPERRTKLLLLNAEKYIDTLNVDFLKQLFSKVEFLTMPVLKNMEEPETIINTFDASSSKNEREELEKSNCEEAEDKSGMELQGQFSHDDEPEDDTQQEKSPRQIWTEDCLTYLNKMGTFTGCSDIYLNALGKNEQMVAYAAISESSDIVLHLFESTAGGLSSLTPLYKQMAKKRALDIEQRRMVREAIREVCVYNVRRFQRDKRNHVTVTPISLSWSEKGPALSQLWNPEQNKQRALIEDAEKLSITMPKMLTIFKIAKESTHEETA